MGLILRLNYRIFFIFLLLLKPVYVFADSETLKKFKDAKTWLYQLQSINFNKVKDSHFDILVTDYAWDGSEEKEYRAGQIPKLKKLTGIVALGYLSIGEAEDYRFYWNNNWEPGNPDFIIKENPQWQGCFVVKYWDEGWQKIIYQYIDRIIEEGFDGLYIDLVDVYQYFEDEKEDAKELMIQFIINVVNYCRETKGLKDFIIMPQNAPELVEDERYLEVISGIGQEETYFRATDVPSEDTEYNEKYLDMVLKNGKKVLTVDYCDNLDNIDSVYKRAGEKGYIPYCTVVDLDKLIDNKQFIKKYFE